MRAFPGKNNRKEGSVRDWESGQPVVGKEAVSTGGSDDKGQVLGLWTGGLELSEDTWSWGTGVF